MIAGVNAKLPIRRLTQPDLVDQVLESTDFRPPDPAPAIGSGATAGLRSRMARFSAPADHTARRQQVDQLLASLDLVAVATAAGEAVALLAGSDAQLDGMQVAAIVPTITMASALGLVVDDADQLVADVTAMARSIGRGEPATEQTDASVARLLSLAGQAGHEPDAAVSLLYQNRDASQGLLVNTLVSRYREKPREPVGGITVRVADRGVLLSSSDGGVEVSAGESVEVDLLCGDREFGHGRHACPGRALSEAIVAGTIDWLQTNRWMLGDITTDADGTIVELTLTR